jgi:predicted flap endonuclease-1-like 5' DNA nuclease
VESVIFHNLQVGHTDPSMDGITPQIAMYLLGCAVIGAAMMWLVYSAHSKRRLEQHSNEWQSNVDNVVRVRDRLINEAEKLRATIEFQQGAMTRAERAVSKARTDLESVQEREKQLSKDLFTLRAEREETKAKMTSFQEALISVRQQAAKIQTEFLKSRDFYKAELTKAFERRKAVEIKLDDSKAEHDSFTNLLHSSVSEKDSVNKMLSAAQRRLDNLDALEQKAIGLEAENAQLKHDAAIAQQGIEVLQRDVEELDELKVQNKELAHCVTSLENSRKQYETDAKRHKKRAGQSEQKSETLRIKLNEVEQNFLDIEKQQRKALKDVRKATVKRKANGAHVEKEENDDLQDIIGIGKVFEHTLHELGIFSFRQIAAFNVSDVAKINRELKEFKGRMEQDDWIGQAKELHYKKYGSA